MQELRGRQYAYVCLLREPYPPAHSEAASSVYLPRCVCLVVHAQEEPSQCPTGPSFKRGPPKGYIHSIEQRWHQVECILATLMESPRAQDIVSDHRNDSFASAILDRVQAGPYVSPGRVVD